MVVLGNWRPKADPQGRIYKLLTAGRDDARAAATAARKQDLKEAKELLAASRKWLGMAADLLEGAK